MMSDDIRLLSVEIQNYRQYYGNHKLNFASREEGFTVIMGKNGEGKSNILKFKKKAQYQLPYGCFIVLTAYTYPLLSTYFFNLV